MKIGLKILITFFLFIALVGCQSDYSLLVKNSKKANIITSIKDYVGLNGYSITYIDSAQNNIKILTSQSFVTNYYQYSNMAAGTEYKTYLSIQIKQIGKDVALTTKGDGFSDKNAQLAQGFIESLKKSYTVEIIPTE